MNFAVLASGNGTNLQALLDAEAAGALAPAHIAVVICNRPGAGALARASAAGCPALVVDHTKYADRALFEQAMLEKLQEHRVSAVVLAGFMRILTDQFVQAFPNKIINTHPALCPSFPGKDGVAQALAYGVKMTGCTVHLVDNGVDTGPIIAQAAVPILDGDTATTLHERIRAHEHRLLPQAVCDLAAGRLQVTGRRVLNSTSSR